MLLVLLSDVESKSKLADPSSVKIYRFKCLHSLAKMLPDDSISQCVREFINNLKLQPESVPYSHAQVNIVILPLIAVTAKWNTGLNRWQNFIN